MCSDLSESQSATKTRALFSPAGYCPPIGCKRASKQASWALFFPSFSLSLSLLPLSFSQHPAISNHHILLIYLPAAAPPFTHSLSSRSRLTTPFFFFLTPASQNWCKNVKVEHNKRRPSLNLLYNSSRTKRTSLLFHLNRVSKFVRFQRKILTDARLFRHARRALGTV